MYHRAQSIKIFWLRFLEIKTAAFQVVPIQQASVFFFSMAFALFAHCGMRSRSTLKSDTSNVRCCAIDRTFFTSCKPETNPIEEMDTSGEIFENSGKGSLPIFCGDIVPRVLDPSCTILCGTYWFHCLLNLGCQGTSNMHIAESREFSEWKRDSVGRTVAEELSIFHAGIVFSNLDQKNEG